jgi:hypothetical protein
VKARAVPHEKAHAATANATIRHSGAAMRASLVREERIAMAQHIKCQTRCRGARDYSYPQCRVFTEGNVGLAGCCSRGPSHRLSVSSLTQNNWPPLAWYAATVQSLGVPPDN